MSSRDSNAPDHGFDLKTGTPELSEPAPVVSPGLIGVATISLASPPRDNGVCRCPACFALPTKVDDWFD
jgi:hypothetical protein